jgi:DNA uptake protein ComE-like DNA-binding protein
LQLNAHSSRSHAILCVKLTQISEDQTLVSRASAIDLAGSEDNRRTENNKERMIESSAINRSLFVLAQCVEAISKKQSRIPYRESKMTRILSIGQNNGLTIMILNLAPVRSYHLDTLSSLNFANRTKKIEVNEVENEPIFRGPPAKAFGSLGLAEPMRNRQPLRQLNATENIPIADAKNNGKPIVKTISVYKDKTRPTGRMAMGEQKSVLAKRPLGLTTFPGPNRPNKVHRTGESPQSGMSKADIEALIERRLDQKLAEKALGEKVAAAPALSHDLQQRLNALEERVSKKEDSEGLQYLLMAKQHQARGEDASALKMYQMAQPFFPSNDKLTRKIQSLQNKINSKREEPVEEDDYRYQEDQEADETFSYKTKPRKFTKTKMTVFREEEIPSSPRTIQLLKIINTKSINLIKQLGGVGPKKAESIVNSLCEMQPAEDGSLITSLEQLGGLRGVGNKTLETMKAGLVGGQWDF